MSSMLHQGLHLSSHVEMDDPSTATDPTEEIPFGAVATTQFALVPEKSEDEPFLYAIFATTRAEELALTQWSLEQKEQFLRMQFAAQRHSYETQFPDAERSIIVHNGAPSGRLFLDRTADELHIVDIALAPEFRNKGIGSAIMSRFKTEATASGKSIRLYVERFNPALRWYERLGFENTSSSEIYLEMIWRPNRNVGKQ